MFITNETEEIETLEKEKERQLQYTIEAGSSGCSQAGAECGASVKASA